MIDLEMNKVTIGIPVFNDVKFIKQCLDSLLNQTYNNIEIIISDDQSTDGSNLICEQYASNHHNIHYFRQPLNLGISRNMEFLLSKCKTPFFMWAGNDDKWSPYFIEKLISPLILNNKYTVSFGPYVHISENNQIISNIINEDYSGINAYDRIHKLILKPSDGFGYGLFRIEHIKHVKFPVWVWPNKYCAYDNIYPLLMYSLVKGDYSFVKSDEPLWFNRVKSQVNINHKIPYKDSIFFMAFLAYLIRKFNLTVFCLITLLNAKIGILNAIRISPRLLFSYFIIPVFLNIRVRYKAFKKGDHSVLI
jgi:glycosyltransferase involved in cell wall biosynthesis